MAYGGVGDKIFVLLRLPSSGHEGLISLPGDRV